MPFLKIEGPSCETIWLVERMSQASRQFLTLDTFNPEAICFQKSDAILCFLKFKFCSPDESGMGTVSFNSTCINIYSKTKKNNTKKDIFQNVCCKHWRLQPVKIIPVSYIIITIILTKSLKMCFSKELPCTK